MIIKSTKAGVGLSANITSDQPNIDGDFVLGLTSKSLNLGAGKAYSFRADVPGGYSFDFAPATGVATPTTTWPTTDPFIRVTGSLTSDGTTPLIIPDLLPAGTFNGRVYYQGGSGGASSIYFVRFEPPPFEYWVLMRGDGNGNAWESAGPNMDAMFPELATFVPRSYNTPNSGTPILTKIQSQQYGIYNADGNDFDGNPLGTIAPLAMLIETTDPITIYFNQGEATPTFSLSDNGVLLQCYTSIPNQVTISAPTGSEVNVTIIGN